MPGVKQLERHMEEGLTAQLVHGRIKVLGVDRKTIVVLQGQELTRQSAHVSRRIEIEAIHHERDDVAAALHCLLDLAP